MAPRFRSCDAKNRSSVVLSKFFESDLLATWRIDEAYFRKQFALLQGRIFLAKLLDRFGFREPRQNSEMN